MKYKYYLRDTKSPRNLENFLILQVNGLGKMDGVDLVSVEQQHEEASYYCFVFSVVFNPPPPPANTAVSGSYLSSLYSIHYNTLLYYRGCGLAYPYDWRGFVVANQKTSAGLSLSICVTLDDPVRLFQSFLVTKTARKEYYHCPS